MSFLRKLFRRKKKLSENEIVDDIIKHLSEKDSDYLKNMERDELGSLHFFMGMQIRNTYGLWKRKWEPKIIDGVDHAEDHPDAISMRIIEKIYDKLKNEKS